MTAGEVISHIRHMTKEVTTESILTNRFIWSLVMANYKLLLERDRGTIIYQDVFNLIREEPEELTDCDFSCVPIGSRVWRIKLPHLISIKSGPIIKRVSSEDGFIQYRIVSPSAYATKRNLRGNKTKYAFYLDGYIYLQDYLPCVTVEYLGEFSLSGCSYLESRIAIPDHLLEPTYKLVMEDLRIFLTKQQDVTMNNNPNA
jgi:hypothetical protein